MTSCRTNPSTLLSSLLQGDPSALTIRSTAFVSNQANVSQGGAVYSAATLLHFDNVTFERNYAGLQGGALAGGRMLHGSACSILHALMLHAACFKADPLPYLPMRLLANAVFCGPNRCAFVSWIHQWIAKVGC